MNCNAKILYYKKLTKGRKRKVFTTLSNNLDVVEFGKTLPDSVWDRIDWDVIDVCDGKIIADIDCHEERGWKDDGGGYAELDVTFTCNKCKHTQFPSLPNQYGINDWINKILDGMP